MKRETEKLEYAEITTKEITASTKEAEKQQHVLFNEFLFNEYICQRRQIRGDVDELFPEYNKFKWLKTTETVFHNSILQNRIPC